MKTYNLKNADKMRKILDTINELQKDSDEISSKSSKSSTKSSSKVLTEDFNDDIDVSAGPTTKVEIEFTGPEAAEVEVYATGMEEVQRLVDLAGIFHKEKAGSMGMDVDSVGAIDIPAGPVSMDPDMGADPMGMNDPMSDPMGIDAPIDDPMGMDDPMADPMGMDAPIDDPTDLPITPGMDSPDLGGMDDPMADPMGMDMPDGGLDVPAGDMGDMDTIDAPGTPNDAPELDFGVDMEPEVEGIEESGERHDYGNPAENLGQERFHMDAYNFAGTASKPVRSIPARSGDNPMIDPSKKGLKEYMADLVEEMEKKGLSEDIKPDDVEEFIAKTFDPAGKDATTAGHIEHAAEELSKDPRELEDKTPEQIAALVVSDEKVAQGGGLNQAERSDMEKDVDKFGDEFDEGRRNYSFKQQVLPFQGLTGTQRLHRNALRRVKSSFRK